MRQPSYFVPINTRENRDGAISLPWFVLGSDGKKPEYAPTYGTFEPLINGENAFRAVYEAIESAEHSIDIICWGFQPSMYFKRDGGSKMIGELLIAKAEAKIPVRVLGWTMEILGISLVGPSTGENNTPGKGDFSKVSTQTDEQRLFDQKWYKLATSGTNPFLRFEGRGFSLWERLEILHFVSTKSLDANTAATQKLALAGAPSHHQKSVLVDYGHAGAVGFVMGHNSLDEYWDKSDHSTQRKAANQGRNGNAPRQDISSKVSGPILEPLHLNFAQAWKNETDEDLVALRPKPSINLEDYANASEMVMAQLVRTQPQHDARDIERLYPTSSIKV